MEEKDKKNYEVAFILEKEENLQDFLRISRQHNIEPQTEARAHKLNLAYKIEKATQAYFGFFRTSANPDDVKALEKDLNTAAGVLRFLIVKLPKEAFEARRERVDMRDMRRERKPMPRKNMPTQPRASETLSNEALEKKIEEILQ
ncbi:MAG: 30S ribosomal protein S6 [Patescibacteria group bacterium]